MKYHIIAAIKRLSSHIPHHFPLIWSVRRQKEKVAITFDDGPTALTGTVLDCLARHDAKATFFVLGCQVDQYPDMIARILAEGHELGIHGVDHSLCDFFAQVKRCKAALSTFDVAPVMVRTPCCVIRPILTLRLWLCGYRSVVYSFDTHDSMRLEGKWKGPPPDYAQIVGGDIVLMHDDNEQCIADLPVLFQAIRRKGLHSVPLSELVHD